MNYESFIDIMWIICNHVIHKKLNVVWLWVFLNIIYSKYKYLIFGIWLRNPDYM